MVNWHIFCQSPLAKPASFSRMELYEYWEFAHLPGKNHQIINQYGGGINYYISGDNRVRLTGEYLMAAFNQATPLPVAGMAPVQNQKDFDTFRMMLQVVF